MSDLIEKVSVRDYLAEMIEEHGLGWDAIYVTSKRMGVTERTVLSCLSNIPTLGTATIKHRIAQAKRLRLSADYINGLGDALKLLKKGEI